MASVALPDHVALVDGPGGPVIEITSPAASARIHLHGAQITSWTPAGASESVLWLSDTASYAGDAAIRGGVPICFPWFGAGRSGDRKPSHGFARLATWRLVDAHTAESGSADQGEETVTVVLELADEDVAGLPGRDVWPHSFVARCAITLGAELVVALTVTNRDKGDIEIEAALHTYLATPDASATTISGLDKASYVDKVTGGDGVQKGVVEFPGEVDRVFTSDADLDVQRPGVAGIHVGKSGSHTTVVWNPGEATAAGMTDVSDWRGFACVEAANAGDDAVILGPGEEHTLAQWIALT